MRFKWQNSLECEQVSAQYYFLGSLVGVLIQSGGERERCERLAGLAEWLVFMLCFGFFFSRQGQGEASARGTTMEGDCLSCIKYLMFVFNFLIFVSISLFSLCPSKALYLAISEVRVYLIDSKWVPRCPLPDCLMEPHLHFIRRRQS